MDSSEWKEKLAKLKEWIERASGIKDKVGDQIAQLPDGAKEEKAALRRPDYFYDRALHLLE